MKFASLVVEQAGGGFAAVAADSLVPVQEAAKLLRDTGACVLGDIAVQAAPGACAVVLASWRPWPVMQFRVAEVATPEPVAEVDTPQAAGTVRPRRRG